MSSKTRTRKTRTTASTTGSTRTLRSVPDHATAAESRTDAKDRLWEALHANPNSTAADLASTAKIGKSTAGKILAKWQKDGSVTRTPGIAAGGRRAADMWAVTDLDTIPTEHPPADDHAPANSEQVDVIAPKTTTDTADTDPTGPTGPMDAEVIEAAEMAEPSADSAATNGDTAPDGVNQDGGGAKAARLAPGALRGMVEDYLRDHPGEEFGPTAIAKALGGKSSGAVSNALDKLVADGTAAKTKVTPRRFALAGTQRDTSSAATT